MNFQPLHACVAKQAGTRHEWQYLLWTHADLRRDYPDLAELVRIWPRVGDTDG